MGFLNIIWINQGSSNLPEITFVLGFHKPLHLTPKIALSAISDLSFSPETFLNLVDVFHASRPVCFVMIDIFDFRKIQNMEKQLSSLLCAFKISIS